MPPEDLDRSDMHLYYQILTRLDPDKAFIINNIPALILWLRQFC
jgi:hypothetical protein